jgi:protein-tyrosine-phosphatase
MKVIMFVCTGNICRSPMAVGLLRQRLVEKGLDSQYQVVSSGVYALDERPASRNGIFVMAERGIDITDHIAHTVTGSDMIRANLVLAMSREHTQALRQAWAHYGWKVYLLSEMAGERKDVKDPFGGSIAQYRAAADVISGYIDRGLERILELA